MEVKNAGASLDSLIAAFNNRVADLQELVIARNMYPGTSITDLSAVDAALKAMELQVQAIKDRLRDETEAIPKAKKLIEASLRQKKKLQSLSIHVPSLVPEKMTTLNADTISCGLHDAGNQHPVVGNLKLEGEPVTIPKEKKGQVSPLLWFISADELDSLSSYMRGRLTLEKVNAAINDMAAYAEANAQLILAPKKKVQESLWEKALELRDIAMIEGIKGKHFFLESDIRGPNLKLDNTGKAILTVSNHLLFFHLKSGELGSPNLGFDHYLFDMD
ncbi:spindle and kinetochore-associated protein 1 homolog isoform X2 [Rhodamnia argentea]|uniref:SKA complex subunit 1 homolog n=1 Tax=Rhodamnia argentea TaxID=178133 RepID=A0A8B8PL42_9MYRT|nr:spindle and kinetochore-associated protein 1 homolog isoform X2 [Rhodamnia argentea]